MQSTRRLWLFLIIVCIGSFAVLGLLGRDIYRVMPPIPAAVVTDSGDTLFTKDDIETGRLVWQSMGGQQVGSIWGHGAYLAPDWSADWLHRELVFILDRWALSEAGEKYDALPEEMQGTLRARLQNLVRNNGLDESGKLIVSAVRAEAIRANQKYYSDLFSDAPDFSALREDYALPDNTIPDAERRHALTAFYFWTAWATATNKPGDNRTYTSNWPSEPLIGNAPTTSTVVWSVASVILLILGVGLLVWHHAIYHRDDVNPTPPKTDPLLALRPSPSMLATRKYFYTVVALWLAQIGLGVLTAHYAVEGHDLYGIPISEILPYAVTRTWHTQLAILWIATAWLATGLYIAPALSGYEPKYQKFGVNFLFVALVIVIVGSFAGQWFAVQQKMGLSWNFWVGHQGYEYVDLGRVWQVLLFVGLLLWLVLMGRALWPVLRKPSENRELVVVLFLSTVAIGLFYGAGLMWGEHTHLSMVEYWRWWVVHLWVEGFFEVFATAVIALLFVRLGLVRAQIATTAVIFATGIFMLGGILGTLHHLYWTGTPTSVIAVGAMFSALEVVPLVLLGFEGYQNYRLTKTAHWVETYKWPVLFFVAVAFWNMLGAGVFGFLINPPISLYYIQGLNTTALHAHSALFGVYGMLGIGLMLFCLRGLSVRQAWDDTLLKRAFWCLNIGLAMMAFMSLMPVGAIQAWAAVSEGLWYARSAEVLQSKAVHLFVWLRVPGDIVFGIGALFLALFAFKLWRGGRGEPAIVSEQSRTPSPAPAD
jgi:nitric oxide reductase subunit B